MNKVVHNAVKNVTRNATGGPRGNSGMGPFWVIFMAVVLIVIILLPRFAFRVRKEDVEEARRLRALRQTGNVKAKAE